MCWKCLKCMIVTSWKRSITSLAIFLVRHQGEWVCSLDCCQIRIPVILWFYRVWRDLFSDNWYVQLSVVVLGSTRCIRFSLVVFVAEELDNLSTTPTSYWSKYSLRTISLNWVRPPQYKLMKARWDDKQRICFGNIQRLQSLNLTYSQSG